MSPTTPKTSKKAERRDRRARAEQLRAEQRRKDRRRLFVTIGGSTLVGLAILGVAVVPPVLDRINDPAKKSFTEFGVPAAAASCDAVVDSSAAARQGSQHVEGKVTDYESVPPAAGKHNTTWVRSPAEFYGKDDVQQVEMLVHNLEHGYLVAWYLPTVPDAQVSVLEDLAKRMAKDRQRTIVAPWDTSYGEFPTGKTVAFTAWGHRQLCGQVSGEAMKAFSDAYPPSQAPEANAAI